MWTVVVAALSPASAPTTMTTSPTRSSCLSKTITNTTTAKKLPIVLWQSHEQPLSLCVGLVSVLVLLLLQDARIRPETSQTDAPLLPVGDGAVYEVLQLCYLSFG